MHALRSVAPELAAAPAVIDEPHLSRMTMGDRDLEREVLELFLRQSVLMIERIETAEPKLAAAAAHTLKGSARGIGAWRVATAAESVEEAAAGAVASPAFDEAIVALRTASLEASAAICRRLGRR
jgi:HPt (histidine-containing phosphotransfer) domain-containing protein